MADAMDTSDNLPVSQEKRRRVRHTHLAFTAEKEIVNKDAKWWGPKTKARWDANHASPVEWMLRSLRGRRGSLAEFWARN